MIQKNVSFSLLPSLFFFSLFHSQILSILSLFNTFYFFPSVSLSLFLCLALSFSLSFTSYHTHIISIYRFLASSGKDRSLCLSTATTSNTTSATTNGGGSPSGPPYKVSTVIASAHKRIVWAARYERTSNFLTCRKRLLLYTVEFKINYRMLVFLLFHTLITTL